MTACDGCGQPAPEQHSSTFPAAGWISGSRGSTADCYAVDEMVPHTRFDACSWACLASIVASNIAEGADELA
jgi:hypothetical protein